jgi:hypothetical protein
MMDKIGDKFGTLEEMVNADYFQKILDEVVAKENYQFFGLEPSDFRASALWDGEQDDGGSDYVYVVHLYVEGLTTTGYDLPFLCTMGDFKRKIFQLHF